MEGSNDFEIMLKEETCEFKYSLENTCNFNGFQDLLHEVGGKSFDTTNPVRVEYIKMSNFHVIVVLMNY